MTWEELKEKAKEIGCEENVLDDALFYKEYMFCKEGLCYTCDGYPSNPFAKNRTPEQMLMILLYIKSKLY